MDYTTLVAGTASEGSIKNWLNDDTLPSATILAEAEQWIYRRLRVRQMLVTDEGTATASQASVPVDFGYLETRHLALTGTDKATLRQALMEHVESSITYDASGNRSTGKPTHYYDEGTALAFNVLTDKAYTYRHIYYDTPAALSTATTTNFLTARHPYMLRSACMMFATDFTKQDDRQLWEQRAYNEIMQANREDDKRYRDLDLYIMPG